MKAHNLNQIEVWDAIAGALDMNKTQIAAKAGIQASVFAQLKIRVKKGVDTYLGSDTLARVFSAFPQVNANFIFGTSPVVLVQTGAGLTDTAHSPDTDALLRTIAVQARRIGELEQALAGRTGSGGSEGQG